MAIFKRGRIYWYHFVFNSLHIQESTKQGNPRVARQMEAAHRTSLAKGEVGIREKKPVPTLSQFCKDRVEPYAKARFEKPSPKTWLWYRFGLKTITTYDELARKKLDQITSEDVVAFAAHLQGEEWAIASVNSALRAVRVVLNLALRWGVIETVPRMTLLRGECQRDRVITHEEEAKYLAAAGEPLGSLATVLLDTGLRPEECFRLRWEDINLSGGRYGTLRVLQGKTKAARRMLPLSARVRAILSGRWESTGKPEEGWIWPAPTKQGHVWHDSIRVQHNRAIEKSTVKRFVIYSFRHTFLTRLGESGCDAWTLARIAGHSSTKMSERYVHPSGDAVVSAFARMPLQKTVTIEGSREPEKEAQETDFSI